MTSDTARAKGSPRDVLSRDRVPTECFQKKERRREEHPFALRLENYGSVASLSWCRILDKLHARAPFSRKTALENKALDSSGVAAGNESLECFDNVSHVGKI